MATAVDVQAAPALAAGGHAPVGDSGGTAPFPAPRATAADHAVDDDIDSTDDGDDDDGDNDGDALHMSEQLLEDWVDPAYWRRVCPFLTVARDSQRAREREQALSVGGGDGDGRRISLEEEVALPELPAARDLGAAAKEALHRSLQEDGFISLSAKTLAPLLRQSRSGVARGPALSSGNDSGTAVHSSGGGGGSGGSAARRNGLVARLARGVERLVALGHSPSSICVYDEHWELLRLLKPLLQGVTGNTASGDVFTFHRSADAAHSTANTSNFGSTPHRDRPNAGPESFRADGGAMYCTVWVALTDATPASSCLYVIPKHLDAGYHASSEALDHTVPGGGGAAAGVAAAASDDNHAGAPHGTGGIAAPQPPALPAPRFENIRATPLRAGGACVFSHRLVHWGSRPSAGAPPRVALAYTLADNDNFEIGEYFSHATYGPFPPLALRVALRAAQAVLFCRQKPFPRGGLGLTSRLWKKGEHFFTPQFRDKVNNTAHWERFMEGRFRRFIS